MLGRVVSEGVMELNNPYEFFIQDQELVALI